MITLTYSELYHLFQGIHNYSILIGSLSYNNYSIGSLPYSKSFNRTISFIINQNKTSYRKQNITGGVLLC